MKLSSAPLIESFGTSGAFYVQNAAQTQPPLMYKINPYIDVYVTCATTHINYRFDARGIPHVTECVLFHGVVVDLKVSESDPTTETGQDTKDHGLESQPAPISSKSRRRTTQFFAHESKQNI